MDGYGLLLERLNSINDTRSAPTFPLFFCLLGQENDIEQANCRRQCQISITIWQRYLWRGAIHSGEGDNQGWMEGTHQKQKGKDDNPWMKAGITQPADNHGQRGKQAEKKEQAKENKDGEDD